MTLTVRLPPPLEEALDAYCSEHGLTKSQVVQESLSTYLVQSAAGSAGTAKQAVSANFAAFQRAGLVGTVRLGPASATREAVRERMAARLRRTA